MRRGSGALGGHVAHQGAVLLLDLRLNGAAQRLAGEGGKVVVRQILQLQLVGGALQAGGVGGGDHRVGQLPDLAHRILEGAVAVDHDLHVLAGGLQQLVLDVLHQTLAVPGEELDLVLGGLVGAQQAVAGVVAAAVHRGGEDLVQAEHTLCAGGLEQALGAGAGVDVAGQNVLGVVQNGPGVVGEEDLHLRAALPDELGVVVHIVHAGEGVDNLSRRGSGTAPG